MSSTRLSISIIAKNEAPNLPALFKSLGPLKETLGTQMVVADTGSTDNTVTIAERAGAEVFHFAWVNDFSKARNFANDQCSGDWILWLDADDVLPQKTAAWLNENLLNLMRDKVYFFNIVSRFQDGGASHFSQSRLFPNGKGIRFSNPIHESISSSVKQLGLTGGDTGMEIIHTGYALESLLAEKKKRNLLFLEREAAGPNAPISVLFSLARTYQVDGRYGGALRLFRRILDTPGAAGMQMDVYLASHIYLGQTLGFMDRISEAAEFFHRHSDMGASHPQYLFEWGKIQLVSGNKKAAAALFERAVSLQPWSWTIPTNWQSIMDAANDFLTQIKKELTGLENTRSPMSERLPLTVQQISVCTIVKDEEEEIAALGRQLPLDLVEWIVVDTGSSDGTLDALAGHNVKPFHFLWRNDFAAARNFSLEKATRPWILWLDADDRLSEGFWKALEKATAGIGKEEGLFACRLIIKSPRDDGSMDFFRQIRLIPNQCGIKFKGRIHEQLGTSLQKRDIPVRDLNVTVIHGGYYTGQSREGKLQRNYMLLEEEIKAFPDDPAVIMAYGNCRFQLGRYLEAAEIYQNFLNKLDVLSSPEIVPEDETVRAFPALIAGAFDMAGDKNAAENWYNISRQWDPEDLQPLYWMGKKALENNDLAAAMDFFEQVIARPVRISHIASDNETLRRNSLGFLVLGKLQRVPKPHGAICSHLSELIQGGLDRFPMDYKIPADYYAKTDAFDDLIEYYSKYLEVFPNDVEMCENFIETMIFRQEFEKVRTIYAESPELKIKSGVLAAFYAKSLEPLAHTGGETEAERVYQAYLNGLRRFSAEPTLLVYLGEWINARRNFTQAYQDLRSIVSPSTELVEYIRQLQKLAEK